MDCIFLRTEIIFTLCAAIRGFPTSSILYRAPLLGGTPEKLATDVDSNITISPDGRKVAFMRYDNPEPGKYQLIVHSLDQGGESALTSGPTGQGLNNPAWSPDGKTILCVVNQPGDALTGLVAVDVATGRAAADFELGRCVGLAHLDARRKGFAGTG